MSLSEVSQYEAQTIGNGLGGLLLITYNYHILALSLGLLAIDASIIFQCFTIDPTLSSKAGSHDTNTSNRL